MLDGALLARDDNTPSTLRSPTSRQPGGRGRHGQHRLWLENPNGVVMHLKAKREGLMLSLGRRPSSSPWTSDREKGRTVTAALAVLTPFIASSDESPPPDADASVHGTFNNGEDITLPRNLFQVRQRYERLPDAQGREPEKWTTTLRADLGPASATAGGRSAG